MRTKHFLLPSMLLICALILWSCDKEGTEKHPINDQIVLLKNCCTGFYGFDLRMGAYLDNKIYYLGWLGFIELDDSFHVVRDSFLLDVTFSDNRQTGFMTYLTANNDEMLIVISQYIDVSIGALYRYEPASNTAFLLRDSSYNISSAVYLENNEHCVYYSYGNQSPNIEPGYYLLDLASLSDSLMFPYSSEEGPLETVNGFDVRPDEKKLLIPLHFPTQRPIIIEYDLTTQEVDTLNVQLPNKQFVWLRYDSSGGQILYSSYPGGVGGDTVWDDSEIGIINRSTLTKRVLDANTNPHGHSLNVFPNWSLDNKHIIYGSAPLSDEPPGSKGRFSLYLLKNVN